MLRIKLKRENGFIGMHSPMKIKINDKNTDSIRIGEEKEIDIDNETIDLQLVQFGRKSNTLKIKESAKVIAKNSNLNYFIYTPLVVLLVITLYIEMDIMYKSISFALILAIAFIFYFLIDSIKIKLLKEQED